MSSHLPSPLQPLLGLGEHVGPEGGVAARWAGERTRAGVSRGAGLLGLRKARAPRERPGPEWGRAEAAPPSGIWAASGGSAASRPRCVLLRLLWVERRRTPAPRGGERIRQPAAGVGAALSVRAAGAAAAATPRDVTAAGKGRGADSTLPTCEDPAGAQRPGLPVRGATGEGCAWSHRRPGFLCGTGWRMPGCPTPNSDAVWGVRWRD